MEKNQTMISVLLFSHQGDAVTPGGIPWGFWCGIKPSLLHADPIPLFPGPNSIPNFTNLEIPLSDNYAEA